MVKIKFQDQSRREIQKDSLLALEEGFSRHLWA